ncbi:unnamed protein product, partial [Amoebophrya sp. A25]
GRAGFVCSACGAAFQSRDSLLRHCLYKLEQAAKKRTTSVLERISEEATTTGATQRVPNVAATQEQKNAASKADTTSTSCTTATSSAQPNPSTRAQIPGAASCGTTAGLGAPLPVSSFAQLLNNNPQLPQKGQSRNPTTKKPPFISEDKALRLRILGTTEDPHRPLLQFLLKHQQKTKGIHVLHSALGGVGAASGAAGSSLGGLGIGTTRTTTSTSAVSGSGAAGSNKNYITPTTSSSSTTLNKNSSAKPALRKIVEQYLEEN